MHLYANLLYKGGLKDQAIQLQEEAIKLAKNPAPIQNVLDKMKRGESIW